VSAAGLTRDICSRSGIDLDLSYAAQMLAANDTMILVPSGTRLQSRKTDFS